ncbi:C-reactive protein-like [Dendropsophus ebraccatus]|uniref:C-reactive protein-like n=1 Tax=Dendropsophus ebraccatus TaxID=150705 RepID=UPI0038318411
MRWIALLVLLLVGLMGTYAEEDLSNKVFLFPKASSTAHVILKPNLKAPLQKLTVCLRSYTELSRNYSLFSLAMSGANQHNAFLIFMKPPDYCSVYVDQSQNLIKTDPDVLDWKHTCVTWDSETGLLQLWVNGKVYPRRVTKKGFSIKPEISIVLGQEQDSFGGGFDLNQCFVGELNDVHMWDYVLTPNDIRKVITNDQTGNVINWRSLNFEIKGSVLIEPKLQCKYSGYASTLYGQC